MDEAQEEVRLTGGNVSGEVLRIATTVRKPWLGSTASMQGYMTAISQEQVDVPKALGKDAQGRQILEFIPGELAFNGPELTLSELARVGALVRDIHRASANFSPSPDAVWEVAVAAPGQELICHNDLAPWNLIIGERWVFIDWDASGPSTRLWDLAYAAQAFTLSNVELPPEEAAKKLKAFVGGYGPDPSLRDQLPEAVGQRAQAMYEFLESSHREGREPWGTMYSSGHGEHWRKATQYARENLQVWKEALND